MSVITSFLDGVAVHPDYLANCEHLKAEHEAYLKAEHEAYLKAEHEAYLRKDAFE